MSQQQSKKDQAEQTTQTPDAQQAVCKKPYTKPSITSEPLFEVGAVQGCSFAPNSACEFTGTGFRS
ncbi:MAG: hypothetical protein CL920_12865 [Deltaproteobacteria bacterium]|nr:hypothetical protein [Deltaproteobacteria bacterium]|tara:strand:+ start:4320 stop:4517 length:198 start_codon:yes stop_codon:yes gene_type:complete